MLDSWPFNLPASEWWSVIYLLVSFAVTILTYRVTAAVGRWFDRQRTPAPDTQSQLTIGQMPQPHQWSAIAYLRGGTRAVAETLVGSAISDGNLVFDQATSQFQLGAGASRPDPLMAQFIASLGQGPLTPSVVRTRATMAA
ncbi:unnamed protein product, partial [marine sediment metagenome]